MVPVDVGDVELPHVARAALGPAAVQRDGLRTDRRERLTVPTRLRSDDTAAAGRREHVARQLTGEQVEPDKIGDVVGAGPRRHVGERALLGDRAVFEDDDTVGQCVGVDRVVRDEQPHAVERLEVPPEVAAHVASRAGVEGGERLVEQQHAGVAGEGACECDALLLPARERRWSGRGRAVEADALQPVRRLRSSIVLRRPGGPQPERHVLERRHVLEQQVVLEHHADRPAVGRHEHVRR